MREIADVHRELYAEAAELYGENIRPKIEKCLDVTDGEVADAAAAREALRARADEALGAHRLLLVPTLAFVAPPADVHEIGERASFVQLHVSVQRARLAVACASGGSRSTACRRRCSSWAVRATMRSCSVRGWRWRPACTLT